MFTALFAFIGAIIFGLLMTLLIRFVRPFFEGEDRHKQWKAALDQVTVERGDAVAMIRWALFDAERGMTRLEKTAGIRP